MKSFRNLVKTIPYSTPGQQTFRLQRGPAAHALGAMGVDRTVFAIVSKLASGTAQVDWKLYKKQVDQRRVYGPSPTQRTEITSHPALTVWNQPNDFFTRQEFVETTQQHTELAGEAWYVVKRLGTLPFELWPVRPDRMDVVPSSTDYLAGYIYTAPGGEKVPLGLDEVIQIRMPNPEDPYRGLGPIQTVLTDIISDKAAAEYNRQFFSNGAMPGGLVQIADGKRWSDQQFNEFQQRWQETHRGIQGAHRVAVLEGGTTWVDAKYSMRDMQFVELRAVSQEAIRTAFGFPKPMLGAVDDVNRANAEAARAMFAEECLVPRLERIKQALNSNFLPMFGSIGHSVEFDYCSPVPDDAEAANAALTAKTNAAKTLVDAGYDPQGALELVGLPDIAFIGRKEVVSA